MQICLHTPWRVHPEQIGGTERFLLDLAKELRCLGFMPFILCSSTSPSVNFEGIDIVGCIPQKHYSKYQTIRVENNPLNQSTIPTRSMSTADIPWLKHYCEQQLQSVDADIIHMTSFVSSLFIEDSRPLFVFNFENPEETNAYLGSGSFDFIAETVRAKSSMLHKHNALFTASNYYAELYSYLMGIEINSLNIGTSISYFARPQSRVDHQTKDKLTPLKILMPSRFNIQQKGQDVALKAAQELKSRNSHFLMTFSGLNPVYSDVARDFLKAADRLGLTDCISVKRFSDIRDAYEETDIVISPERYCSYGLSITESLALGIPTVLSNIPTYQEIGGAYAHALFFEVDAHLELVDRIEEALLLDPKKIDRNAIDFRVNHDIRDCAKQLSKHYLGAKMSN
jgi:glycosyltransferase involved in cell wall biosynthesis